MQTLRDGQLIDDRYEVVEVLGVGGFGVVYKARQPQFDRLVAVKVLRQTMADTDERARFDLEAKAMNALKHKNIVGLYGVGFWHGAPYMVTELASGQNLMDVLAKYERLDRTRAVSLTHQILSALSCAHQQGIVHRDLKPSNIILSREPDGGEVVKIIDFGLAKMLPGYGVPSQKLTETGFALGTAQYMSPEQCMGQSVDGRSDLYSAGCILYQMLTGRLPFDAVEIVELMYQHLNAEPQPLRNFLPEDGTTLALQNFCDNCLAKDRDMRYANADEALRDIDAIGMGESRKVKAFSTGSSSRKKRLVAASKARQSKFSIVAPLAFLALASAAVFCWLYKNSEPPAQNTRMVADEKRALELGSAVLHSLEGPGSSENEIELTTRLHRELITELAEDAQKHTLTPYYRARLSYLLANWYRGQNKLAEAEKYAQLGWSQRRLATNYPERARDVLLNVSVRQGKFAQADQLVREAVKDEAENLLAVIRNITADYASVNRMDRARLLLEGIAGAPKLAPRARQFCYDSLGDSCLAQCRPREAKAFYERGAGITDGDSIFPNPCWLGVARMAFYENNPAKAHEAMQNLSANDFVTHHFPEYEGWGMSLADAAWRRDQHAVDICAKHLRAKGPHWGDDSLLGVIAFDDELIRKALQKNGFKEAEASLAQQIDKHVASAKRKGDEPKLQQIDSVSGI